MDFNHINQKLLGDPVILRVYKVLYHHSQGMTGRALGAVVGTSPFKINQVLRSLVTQGVVLETAVGRAHLYRLNGRHIFVTNVIGKLIDFEKNIFTNMGRSISQYLNPQPLSIIIYGSTARGDRKPESDIDLLLVYKNRDEPGPTSSDATVIESISSQYNNPASVVRMKIADFQKPREERRGFVRNIIRDGKSIAGLSIIELLNYHEPAD